MTYKIGSQKLVKSSFETSKDSITGSIDIDVPDVVVPDIDYDKIQSEIEAGKQEATDKINSGLGGYVTKTRNELLIMDTEDKATARSLWRWNINGLGFSSNGYSGPYATAITNDGKINADRILVGTIDGALIRANTIKANSLEISTVQKINAAITADDATAIMNTRLEVYDGNIKTHINTVTESKKTEAINSANQNTASAINSAKTELNQNINTAKSDLTSKINLKANASDVYGKSDVYTKTQTDSAIKQSKDNISLEVSNKYETKVDAAAKITNLSIGGVNLYLNTKIINRSDWANIGNWNTSETYNEFTVFSRTGAWMGLYQNIRYEVGQTYTLSAYVKSTNGAKLHFYLNGSGSTIATSFNGGDTISDSWTRVWATFRVNGSDFGKPRFENPTDGATLKIYGFKLEKGNKATDWSLAPEDIDSLIDTAAINAINSANQNTATVIANYYTKSETDSKISVAKDEINLGVSNKYETKANVETKVTSTLNSAKSYADTKKTEAINSAATDATSKVNAAKSELNTAIGKKANAVDVYSKAEVYTKSQTDSAIKVAKDEINLGVSNTYETKANVETKVSATLNSAKSYADTKKTEAINTASTDATNKANNAKNDAITSANNTLNSTIANYYTKAQTDSQIKVAKDAITQSVSSTYETKTEVTNKINGIQIGSTNLVLNSDFSSGTSKWNAVNHWTIHSSLTYNNKKVIHLSRSGLSADSWSELCSNNISVKTGEIYTMSLDVKWSDIPSDQGCSIFIWGYKADGSNRQDVKAYGLTGSKDWTRIAITGTVPSGVEIIRACITHRRNGAVYATNFKLEKGNKATEWSPAPEDISTNINNAKTDAINTAATDASNKVNSAKSELNTAINKKANSADVYKKTEVYTKNETNSQITTAKNEINQSVSSTYETKTNVTTKLNNLSVSATNLLDNSAPLSTSGWSNWSSVSGLSTNMEVSTTDNSTHGKQGKITFSGGVTGTAGRHRFPVQKLTSGKTYSWSIWLRSGSGNLTVDVGQEQNGRREVSVGTSWTRFTHTYTANDNQYYTFIIRPKNVTEGNSIYFHSVMLVEGDKPVAWQTSPTEVLSDKTNIEQRVSSAESKITESAITNTVKKNFYTKEETNNQITSKGYQTSSQVQQTVDNLQIKFTESGGYNLLKNGKATLNTSFWASNGGGISRTTDAVYKTCFKTSLPAGIKYNGGDSGSAIRLKNNTRYVYEALVFSRTAISGTSTSPLHFWCGTTATTAGQSQCTVVDYQQAVPKTNTWTKCYVHILTKASGEVWFTPFVYTGGSLTGDIWVTEISLSESSIQTPYSPHPSEIYDGLTQIDKNGITVSTSRGAYTQFSSEGMNSFNNSGQQTMGIRNGGITFNPYSSNQLGAYITQSALWGGSAAANGLAISTANNGTYIALGTSSLSDANATLNMDQALTISAIDSFQPIGINFWKDVHAHGYGIRQLSHLQLAGSGAIQFDYLNNSPSTIYEAVDSGHSLYVMGGYQMHLGCMDGKGVPKGVIWMKNSTDTHSYTHWDFHNYTMYNMKTASSFINTASHRATESYGVTSNVDGVRYLYRDVELIEGKAIRSIPNGYRGCAYDIVSIVCKGRGSAWIETEDENRFEINGDCKSVNIEIIIYPSEDIMAASMQQLEEPPTLELPKKTEPEEALLITNAAI